MTHNKMVDVLKYLDTQWISEQIWYIFSSKGRESKNISKFLKEQVQYQLLDDIIDDMDLNSMSNNDNKIIAILKWVMTNIRYIGDNIQYRQLEYWANVKETTTSKLGDCEDGAILIYALARRAGIPIEQIKLVAGEVFSRNTKNMEGHCWIQYKSVKYPYVWYYIDWCYFARISKIPNRPAYTYGKDLYISPFNNEYYKAWFIVDELKGSRRLI